MKCQIESRKCKGPATTTVVFRKRFKRCCEPCRSFAWLDTYKDQQRREVHADRAEFPRQGWEWALQPEPFPWGDNEALDPRDERARVAQFIRQARRFEYVEGDTENELIPPSPQYARVTQDMRAQMKRFSPQVQEMIADQILREKYENRQNDN